MRTSYLLLSIFVILTSCSSDDVDYININGKVERAVNGDGSADQLVSVMTRKSTGSGLFSTIKVLDSAKVITDANGNFSIALLNNEDAFITVVHQGDENFSGSGIWRDYTMDESVIIKTDKNIKFKALVNITNPNDQIDFFA